ncbi:hypothetical protein TNCV_3297091 [Trichonephila clavipes]|uniref:Uncharacterized protein n=1 Tax=Trichonephila clavipes TaxID=2585209 RepID=A0A8X6T2Z3_TRICX|nr:hypothetical protein TNCV_3297091 [Trichonephila clavipes]
MSHDLLIKSKSNKVENNSMQWKKKPQELVKNKFQRKLVVFWYRVQTRDKASHGPTPIPLGYRGHIVASARISSQSSRHCRRSPLPHASALIQRDFGCVLGVQQTKQLPHVAKVHLVWWLGV